MKTKKTIEPDLHEKLLKLKARLGSVEKVAQFLGVTRIAVSHWLKGNAPSMGYETHIRMKLGGL